MGRIKLSDVTSDARESWNDYTYENYNKCGKCKGALKKLADSGKVQTFKCLKCFRVWKLDVMEDVITLA